MTPATISVVVFAVLLCAALLGMVIHRWLPDHHRSDATKDAVRIGMGSVGTMAALVLGLLVASTRAAYDNEKSEVIQLASKVVYLDRVLANYGEQASECRDVLRRAVQSSIDRIWAGQRAGPGAAVPSDLWTRDLPTAIQQFVPQDDAQRTFKAQAAQAAGEVGQMRWLLFEQAESSISFPLLAIMVFWLALTFCSVGLFAPTNVTVVVAQFLAAFSVAGAIFLILELDQPFGGLIRISSEPMVNALAQLQK